MAAAFLSWWLRQMAGLLPARWRRTVSEAAEQDDGVILSLSADAVEATRRRRRRMIHLGRFGLDPAGLASLRVAVGSGRRDPIRLALPPSTLLEQPVMMPIAAERSLRTALRWEMDRLTPFAADSVFWTWRVLERDRARGRLRLQLLLVAKAAVLGTLETLSAAGLTPTRLEAAGDPARQIPLAGGAKPKRFRTLAFAGTAFCVSLSLAAIITPFLQQRVALGRLEDQIATLRPQMEVAERLRRQISERSASNAVVAAEANRVGDTLRILAALTDLLPDGTTLSDLALNDRSLTFGGQSTQASALIPILAADPAVRNPVFAAPVTRNEATRTEAFSIRAEMQP